MIKKSVQVFSFLSLIVLARGGETMAPPAPMPEEIAAPSYAENALKENSVAVLLTSGFLPNEPFVSSSRAYSIVPISVGALWTLDDVSNDDLAWGIFRGNTSFRFSSFYHDVLHGPESRFVGILAGPQYNFVQKGWNLVPFIGAQVGLAFCDSGRDNHLPYQQGEDFCFTFTVNAGARYFLSEKWSLIGEVVYQHFSNAGLSEPAHQNNGLDLFGPQISLAYAF